MIRIRVEREKQTKAIRSFHVEGHAGYEDPGKDIVCAGVSAVTVGTVNAIMELTGISPVYKMEKGLLHVDIPDGLDSEQAERVQLLLEGMCVMLRSIRNEYRDFVNISTKKGG